MKTYLRRSVKYFIQLVILLVILFAFMLMTDTAAGGNQATLSGILLSRRGLILCIAIVVLSLFYPRFGFVTRRITGDIVADREKLIRAMVVSGFKLINESGDGMRMTFCADSTLKHITTMWEDKIEVSEQDGQIVISGIRKEVVKIEFRFKAYLQNENQ